jgi:hypothetical protein
MFFWVMAPTATNRPSKALSTQSMPGLTIQWSIVQNFPVRPIPVWTLSTTNKGRHCSAYPPSFRFIGHDKTLPGLQGLSPLKILWKNSVVCLFSSLYTKLTILIKQTINWFAIFWINFIFTKYAILLEITKHNVFMMFRVLKPIDRGNTQI